MPDQIKEKFAKLNVKVTKATALEVTKYLLAFELRDDHPDALNTSLLGVHKINFLPKDNQHLFNIFGVDRIDVEDIIKECDSIDTDFKVASDVYNLFAVYVMHRAIYSTELSMKEKEQFILQICTMLHYKFFSSIINYNFPYGADKAVMETTIDSLSLKFDIKQSGTDTWKLVMMARAKDIVGINSIHYKTIKNFTPDKKVLYLITDTQTRIRAKLRLVINEYYVNKEKKKRIDTYNLINDVDGEKLIKNLSGTFDMMIAGVSSMALNANRFINHDYITLVCKFNNTIRADLLRTLLMKFSTLAMIQSSRKEQDKVILAKNKVDIEYYEGFNILLTKLIQQTYRLVIADKKVDVRSKLSVLDKVMDVYRSSRISDPEVLLVKDSIDRFVKVHGDTRREATITSLKIGFILYIILLTFNYL